MKTLAAIVLLVSSFPALALCPPPTMSDPAQVHFNSDSLMIVTHASSNDNGRLSSKFGVDAAVSATPLTFKRLTKRRAPSKRLA